MSSVVVERGTPTPSAIQRSSRRALGWWGMVLLICTEGMIFALLLFSYFFVRANTETWPPDGIKDPELVKSGIRTVLLLASSIPVHLAQKGIEKGSRRQLHAGLAVALVLAGLFLAGHVEEYLKLWNEYTFADNVYGSLFYTITGLHSLHLVVGMASAAYVWARATAGHYSEHHHLGVETTAMYWHFVDVVWIAVYSSLYLSVTLL